ncbi:Protein DA1-related 2 [Capsicum baccatum]|uniref:Protein DA1-related 2 n=1 Tax=Capsicum baccatum TaxID=33114 RepID=A0A2G2X5Q7_CAPBA|nr:Protein DA1-related 2 [Capsicum baccatum]
MSSSSVNQYSQPCIYERKSRFMKWLTKIFKGGSVNRGLPRGHQPQFLGDENMFWRAPLTTLDDLSKANKEKEELDHATAVSLTEDLKQPGYKCRTDNDEDLGRPLSHDLSSSSYPPYPPPYSLPYAPWEYNPRSYRICSGCHGDIGSGNCLGCMGTFFHPECFLCCACGYPITEHEFSLSGNKTYHKSCFREMTRPKCEVCYQFQWNARYVSLGDGRSLCLECMESAIMDTGDCQPLYHSIRDYYEGMNMKIEQQVPMLLVERQALNEAIGGEKHGFHHMPETRGLCLSEEQTITSLLKRPRMSGCKVVGMRTRPQKLTQKYEVTAILVLFGLPRLLTGAILAHELMHAWLRLKGFRNLSLEVEEGICQVLSYMWLESEVMLGSRDMPSTSTASSSSMSSTKKGVKSGVENKLGEFFMHQIAHDTSPTYGGGFRAANEAVNKYGLRFTLDHIRLTGSFPL